MARDEQFSEFKTIAATDINSFNEMLEENARQGWIPGELCVTPDKPAGNHADDYGMQYSTILRRNPGMHQMAQVSAGSADRLAEARNSVDAAHSPATS